MPARRVHAVLCSFLVFACTTCPPPSAAPPVATNPVVATPATPTQESPEWPPLDVQFLDAYAATQSFRLGRPIPLAVTKDSAVLFRRTQSRDRRADLYELSSLGK